MLRWRGGGPGNTDEAKERQALAAAAKIMLKPKSVNELRLLVETTAAKNHYNPIESLIELTRKEDVKDSEKIAIHKALLPFLVPQMATPKPEKEEKEHGVKVTVTQFVFPSNSPTGPLHQEKPAMVEVTPS